MIPEHLLYHGIIQPVALADNSLISLGDVINNGSSLRFPRPLEKKSASKAVSIRRKLACHLARLLVRTGLKRQPRQTCRA
jgi:hypothetical protein